MCSKKKKYYNINVNLNKHKNLKPLSLATKKDIQKVNLGIKSEKELNYAINEIRQRLNKLEKSQRNNNNFDMLLLISSDKFNFFLYNDFKVVNNWGSYCSHSFNLYIISNESSSKFIKATKICINSRRWNSIEEVL